VPAAGSSVAGPGPPTLPLVSLSSLKSSKHPRFSSSFSRSLAFSALLPVEDGEDVEASS